MCKNPQVEIDRPAVAELMADVAAAVARRGAAVSEDVYEAILQEIPQLRDDKPLLTLLASSVDSNVDTCLQIMQHRIDLAAVPAPAAATEYARRLAQRRTPLTALLRAYRVGHACFSDRVLRELARQAADAEMISAATLSMSRWWLGTSTRLRRRWSLPTSGPGRTGCRTGAPSGPRGSATCWRAGGSTWAQRRPPWATGCASITWAWCAG